VDRQYARVDGQPAVVISFPIVMACSLARGARVLLIVERVIAETLNDPADAAAYSPLRLVDGNTTPFYVTWGTEDIVEVIPSSEEFKAALAGRTGHLGHHVWLMFNHWDTAHILKFEDNAWVQ
jgi:hypothetical protein